jgi:hypothetical protein
MRALAVFLAMLGASTLPASAAAATYAPPGNAGIQQYFDPLPSSGGDVAAPGVSGAGAGANGSLPAGLRHRLARQGAAGAAVARLIAANPVASSRPTGRASGRGSSSSTGSAGKLAPLPLTAAPRGGLSQLLDAAVTGTGAGGVGILLPLVLVAALGVVIAGVVRRRRTNS